VSAMKSEVKCIVEMQEKERFHEVVVSMSCVWETSSRKIQRLPGCFYVDEAAPDA
jgi:hypothetical protein